MRFYHIYRNVPANTASGFIRRVGGTICYESEVIEGAEIVRASCSFVHPLDHGSRVLGRKITQGRFDSGKTTVFSTWEDFTNCIGDLRVLTDEGNVPGVLSRFFQEYGQGTFMPSFRRVA